MNIENFYTILNALISSFVVAGGLGFINYVILEKLGIIKSEKNKSDEKLLIILFFSIVNYVIFLLIFAFPTTETKVKSFIILLAIGILGTLSLSIVLSFTLYPLLAKFFNMFVNWFRTVILKKVKTSNQTPKESLFCLNTVLTFIYIFDFDKNKMGEGYLDGWINDNELNHQISLNPAEKPTGLNFDDVEDLICKIEYTDPDLQPRHLIDFDEKVHYFIVYQPI